MGVGRSYKNGLVIKFVQPMNGVEYWIAWQRHYKINLVLLIHYEMFALNKIGSLIHYIQMF